VIRENEDGETVYLGLPEAAKRALNAGDPYGVPTGYVPRVDRYDEALQRGKRVSTLVDDLNRGRLRGPYADRIEQAVDNYILMERKARAWDWLRENIQSADYLKVPELTALMDGLLTGPPP
jgi:hypothetical protein